MTTAQQERLRALESLTNAVMEGKERICNIESRMGQQWANDVKESLKARGYFSNEKMTPQQFFAKQDADRRAFFQNRSAQGIKTKRVSQQDHNYIVGRIFDSVDASTKPVVRSILEAYGREQHRAPEWAARVAGHKHPRKMGKTLAEYKDHLVLKDLKEGGMLSQTHKSMLQNSTYSGFAALLFSGSQNARERRAMKERIGTLEARVFAVEAETARAHARIDASEQWKTDAVDLYRAGKSYGAIAVQTGKGKTTLYEYIQILISAGKLEVRTSRRKC